jgi:asparagine synthase (glutamine-hydrolysing)
MKFAVLIIVNLIYMCGISGIINKDGCKVDKHQLEKMNDKIIHRGPNSGGFYFDNNVGFGHRRLSIVDLSDLGRQPMSFSNKYVITYNGEVYNYREIRAELILMGYSFKSGTDTEVILASFDLWGEKCLDKFNGMWAFAIHDIEKKKIFISRDRFGVKPIYFKEDVSNFYFGSEIKQLLNDGDNELNEDVLLESMLTHFDNHTEHTYFKGIQSFPSSHYLWYDLVTNEKIFKKYYNLQINSQIRKLPTSTLINDFKNLFVDAIKLRLRSDVKVGTCLSGGLDSSSLSAIASQNYHTNSSNKFNAITAQSTDSANDETHFALEVSEKFNLEMNIVTPSFENFVSTIDEVIYTQEEPFGSPSMFMGWHVFKKAKELDCSVMLNGQGGDEILLGYERYFSSTLSVKNIFTFLNQLYFQFKNSRLSFLKTIGYFLYFRSSELRKNRLKRKSFLKKKYIQDKYFEYVERSAAVFNDVDSLQLFEILTLQLPHLLRYEDRNSMRHSIETRLPFLDYRLVEFAISLPVKLKINNGWTKYVLRKSIENILPKSIAWRKNKYGFEAPDRIWLNKYEKEMLESIVSSKLLNHFCDIDALKSGYTNLSLKDKWMYFNISRWEKVYNVVLSSV